MEQIEQQELEERIEILEKPRKSILTYIKFLLIPGYIMEDLAIREFEYEKTISKRKFIRRLKSTLTIIGISLIFVIVTFAVFCPWIAPQSLDETVDFYPNPTHPNQWPYSPPSAEHPLGTTKFGRDLVSILIWGARFSLTIALPAVLMAVFFGIIIGTIAAYYGGWIDSVLMRIMDMFLAFPGLILVLVFIAMWGQRLEYFIMAYGILAISGYSRLIRGSVLQARELPYVEAARAAGAGNARIMFRHLLPNCVQPVIISFTFNIGGVILGLAGLSFLGFNDPRLVEWGFYIAEARPQILAAPWAVFWPGFMIMITVLGFMLTGDGLRDALDPRLRNI
ncbi:MAG: ABC transporter permease [Candidatus Hodarchaeota archaeon]